MRNKLTIVWFAWAALVVTLRCHGEDERMAEARLRTAAESPVLLQMVDQASIIAHVVVTNLECAKYWDVTGNRACTLACSVSASGFVRGFFIEGAAGPCSSRRTGRADKVCDEACDEACDEVCDEVWELDLVQASVTLRG